MNESEWPGPRVLGGGETGEDEDAGADDATDADGDEGAGAEGSNQPCASPCPWTARRSGWWRRFHACSSADPADSKFAGLY